MGIIILAGASAAVNALLMAVSKMLAVMASEGLLPSFFAWGKNQTTLAILVLGVAIAAMMATGMAGEPILETYTRAGICLWLVHYAVVLGAVITKELQRSPGVLWQITKDRRVMPFVGWVAISWAFVGMFILAADWKLFLKIVVIILASGLAFAALWIPFSKKKGWLK
jgi:amino acid transporter